MGDNWIASIYKAGLKLTQNFVSNAFNFININVIASNRFIRFNLRKCRQFQLCKICADLWKLCELLWLCYKNRFCEIFLAEKQEQSWQEFLRKARQQQDFFFCLFWITKRTLHHICTVNIYERWKLPSRYKINSSSVATFY